MLGPAKAYNRNFALVMELNVGFPEEPKPKTGGDI